jgi:pyruvate/2-oxoglutarate dehydrogenase complex dihydrolipoamide acyltransferase (E2) component
MPDFKLPDLGEGVTEAEVDRWLVKEGDVIAEDDPLVELITDKATAEVPSPYEGTVVKIHVAPGAVVPVGTVLVTISNGGPEGSARADHSSVAVPAGANPPSVAVLGAPAGTTAEAPVEAPPERSSSSTSNGVKAMPPVRKMAAQLGVDLTGLQGSGPSGQITRSDVEAAAGSGASAADSPRSAGGERREAFRGVRRKIAERMSEAHRIIPPVTHVEECDVTELDATRNLANERAPDQPRLTFLPFIVKAVVQGLKDHPSLNASLDEEAGEIVFYDRYDIGVAVDTPAGLVVPVVKDADKKRLREIAVEIDRLAKGAREGTLGADELRGGTFTVTSPGPFGGLMATPLVLHPQSGILGVHRAVERPVVRNGQIVVRKMMNLSITFDHRILDGMTAARFALDIVKLLEHPMVLALEA